MPGVTVTGRNTQTGFVRTEVSDGEGLYRLTALPVGTYDVTAELQGFSTFDRKGIVVNVVADADLDIDAEARRHHRIDYRAARNRRWSRPPTPRSAASSTSTEIESLPLNGRQFANLAIDDPRRRPRLPLRSDQEHAVLAADRRRQRPQRQLPDRRRRQQRRHRRRAAPALPARGDPGVQLRHAALQGGVRPQQRRRDEHRHQERHEQRQGQLVHLRARQEPEREDEDREDSTNVDKQDYRRYQYGGSFGGPIVQNKAHFFAAFERTQQDTAQAVTRSGLFPGSDGVFPTPSRENLFTGQGVREPDRRRSTRRCATAATPTRRSTPPRRARVPENWGDSDNTFNSINLNHNWVLAGSKLNEFVFQYADFANHILARTDAPQQTFPNGVTHRLQHQHAADDHPAQVPVPRRLLLARDRRWAASATTSRPASTTSTSRSCTSPSAPAAPTTPTRTSTNDLNGPISRVTRNKPGASANLPMDQYGFYIQDDWRVNDRLTVNAGLRYDLVTGFLIDQSKIPNYIALTAAAAAGRFDGVPGFDEFGKKAQEDKNNCQPRIGAVSRPPRRRPGRRPRRLGHLLRLRLHEREHPVPGPERARGVGRRLRR